MQVKIISAGSNKRFNSYQNMFNLYHSFCGGSRSEIIKCGYVEGVLVAVMEIRAYFDPISKQSIMKRTLLLQLLLAGLLSGYSQTPEEQVKTLLKEGVALHDEGKYTEAIAKYDQALQLDKNSVSASLEKAMTLFYQQKYQEAIELCKKTIKKNKGHKELYTGYVTYGNALDLTGKKKDAVKIYNEGIEQFPDYFQLYFNKGVTLSTMSQFQEALSSFELAVQKNPEHASSHSGIARLNLALKKQMPAYMAFARFLAIEPASKRSVDNFKLMRNLFVANTQQTGEKSMTISINIDLFNPSGEKNPNDFSSTELLLLLNEGLNSDSARTALSDVELYENQLNTMINSFTELRDQNRGFYWTYYVPYFIEMKQKELSKVFSYIAFASTGDDYIVNWLQENEAKVEEFLDWSKNYAWPD